MAIKIDIWLNGVRLRSPYLLGTAGSSDTAGPHQTWLSWQSVGFGTGFATRSPIALALALHSIAKPTLKRLTNLCMKAMVSLLSYWEIWHRIALKSTEWHTNGRYGTTGYVWPPVRSPFPSSARTYITNRAARCLITAFLFLRPIPYTYCRHSLRKDQ